MNNSEDGFYGKSLPETLEKIKETSKSSPPVESSWEKEYARRFRDIKDSSYWWRVYGEIQQFIRGILAEREADIRGKLMDEVRNIIRAAQIASVNLTDEEIAYNGAIKDVLQDLNMSAYLKEENN